MNEARAVVAGCDESFARKAGDGERGEGAVGAVVSWELKYGPAGTRG